MFNYFAKHPRRALGGLATILASVGLAVGSGATFTSHTANLDNTFTSGSLVHTNSKDGVAIVTGANLKPGDVSTGTVKIKNTGTLKGTFKLSETNDTNGFGAGNLKLKIEDVTSASPATIYSGDLGGVAAAGIAVTGDWAVSEERTYKFTVTLDAGHPQRRPGQVRHGRLRVGRGPGRLLARRARPPADRSAGRGPTAGLRPHPSLPDEPTRAHHAPSHGLLRTAVVTLVVMRSP